jgi:hypothetical protein
MADLFEAHISQLDPDVSGHKPTLAPFYQAYGVMQKGSQVVPAVATELRHLTRHELARVLIDMGLTMGSHGKAARARARRNAATVKKQARWSMLSSLVAPKGADATRNGIVKSATDIGMVLSYLLVREGRVVGVPAYGWLGWLEVRACA